jgi:hypothetical protein
MLRFSYTLVLIAAAVLFVSAFNGPRSQIASRFIAKRLPRTIVWNSEFERSEPVKKVVPQSEPQEQKEEPNSSQERRPRDEISSEMRERLRRELISQGADPNYSRGPILGNPILLISAFIAILVIVGGKGYFY